MVFSLRTLLVRTAMASGGEGDLEGKPAIDKALLAIGAIIANLIGTTTGALYSFLDTAPTSGDAFLTLTFLILV